MNYQRINNLIGWFTFLIASYVFISTIEPTGSFWDCGEFIATAHKLEVGHPPGAPLFLMLARIFILFAGDNVAQVPIMVNIMSAMMSAFTVLFLFWTITALAKKMVIGKGEATTDKILAIMGAGFVGAVAYTFTDSFWFSAVEGEVYREKEHNRNDGRRQCQHKTLGGSAQHRESDIATCHSNRPDKE